MANTLATHFLGWDPGQWLSGRRDLKDSYTVMLSRALKEHHSKQVEMKSLQGANQLCVIISCFVCSFLRGPLLERRRKEAVAAADAVAKELVDSLNSGYVVVYVDIRFSRGQYNQQIILEWRRRTRIRRS